MNTHKTPENILIIAGCGIYPQLIIEGARSAGVKRICVVGIKGSTWMSTCRMADEYRMIPFGNVTSFNNAINDLGCNYATLAGQINPLCLFRTKLDAELLKELSKIGIRNAHTLFGRLVEKITELGLEVLPSSLFMGSSIPSVGVLTKRAPTDSERFDITFGNKIAMSVCNLDIGQTIVVKDGIVLAVEGFDGTDVTIKRGGKIGRRDSVVVKVAKEQHDMRFDIPVIGTRTITVLKKAKISALSVQAGRTLILDLPNVVKMADKHKIAIEAVESGLPYAPILTQNKM